MKSLEDNLSLQMFPEETDNGSIRIEQNKIICQDNRTNRTNEVNIIDLQYAYVVVNSNKEASLFLFDHHQSYLPTNFKGFEAMYLTLSKQLDFNNKIFFDNINKTDIVKEKIWVKKEDPTYNIIQNKNYDDYELGFEIQSPEKTFVLWDTTYEQLEVKPHIHLTKSPYDQQILKFNYPVRIGNIILSDLTAYFDNERRDVPVQHYYTHCKEETYSDASYYELKKQFIQDFKKQNQLCNYERTDQKNYSFNANKMKISLVYTYNSDWQYDDGSTSFSIINERDYPELLTNETYDKQGEIHDYLLINEKISTSSDYKRNSRIKKRTSSLTIDKVPIAPLIWIDLKNNKIGFADRAYYQLFTIDEIKSFTIENVTPAKGSGRATLLIYLKNTKSVSSIFRGACYVFDHYKDLINQFTGKPVNVAPESADC